jgi:hypothetical protein
VLIAVNNFFKLHRIRRLGFGKFDN